MSQTKIEQLVEENEHLLNVQHNLCLYLDYVRQVDPALWGAMLQEFDGMAGYDDTAVYERAG